MRRFQFRFSDGAWLAFSGDDIEDGDVAVSVTRERDDGGVDVVATVFTRDLRAWWEGSDPEGAHLGGKTPSLTAIPREEMSGFEQVLRALKEQATARCVEAGQSEAHISAGLKVIDDAYGLIHGHFVFAEVEGDERARR